jgi:hypothetical protein
MNTTFGLSLSRALAPITLLSEDKIAPVVPKVTD